MILRLKITRNCPDSVLAGSNTFLRCDKNVNGKLIGYTESGETINDEDMRSGAQKARVFPFGQGVKNVFFNIDTTNKNQVAFLDWFKTHSRLTKPVGNPEFILTNENEEVLNNVTITQRNIALANKINGLGTEIYDLCHYAGLSVAGKTIEDIYSLLLNFKTGLAYYGTYIKDGVKHPLADKIFAYSSDKEAGLYVTCNKGILLNIINKEQGMYYFNTQMIGNSEQDVYSFFKNNDKMFDVLLKDVSSNEKTLYTIVSPKLWETSEQEVETTEKKKKTNSKERDEAVIAEIRKEAKAVGVINWWQPNIDNVEAEILKLKEKHIEKETKKEEKLKSAK